MMMGFGGGTGMALVWLFGGMSLVAIWAGVWWILASIGATPQRTRPDSPAGLPSVGSWQQPHFAERDDTRSAVQPEPLPTESDHR